MLSAVRLAERRLLPLMGRGRGRGRGRGHATSRPRGQGRQRDDAPSAYKRGAWFLPEEQARSERRGRPSRFQAEAAPERLPHSSLAWYQGLFSHCLDLELKEQQLQVDTRLQTWPLERLIKEGYALVKCSARKHGSLIDRPIVRFSQGDGRLPWHTFGQGDLVTISKSEILTHSSRLILLGGGCRTSPLDNVDAEGVVYENRAWFLSVVFEKLPQDLRDTLWRLDKGSNKVAYDRMQKALKDICCVDHPLPLWLRPCVLPSALIHLSPNQQQGIDVKEIQQACLMTSDSGGASDTNAALHAMQSSDKSRESSEVDQLLETSVSDVLPLNESQLRAVQYGLKARFSLIQGPPGTGKTATACHLAKAWRALHKNKGPVLATAQSNVAVDQLLSGCLKLGLNAVRLGQPVRVTEELQGKTLDALLQQHPRMAEVEKIQAEIRRLQSNRGSLSGAQIGFMHRDLAFSNKALRRIMDEIMEEIVSSADVICATCIGAAADLLQNRRFGFIVLDESSQCTEPEALVPLMKAKRNASVALIGDHQQLPPTVISQDHDCQRILSTSLFQRIIAMMQQIDADNGVSSALLTPLLPSQDQPSPWMAHVRPFLQNIKTSMLREQYRMHPVLSQWPSQKFYNGWLKDAVIWQDRLPPRGIPWRQRRSEPGEWTTSPLLFVSTTAGHEGTNSSSMSKYNVTEAQVVISVVNRFMKERDVQPSGIGIISPYTAQVNTIKNLLSGKGHNVVGSSPEEDTDSFIEVKTVDGYQGREKDVIIFSAVRSNRGGQIGFLNDYRRFNVAVTRARRGLIVIGDPRTLQHDALWRDWLDYVHHLHHSIDAAKLM